MLRYAAAICLVSRSLLGVFMGSADVSLPPKIVALRRDLIGLSFEAPDVRVKLLALSRRNELRRDLDRERLGQRSADHPPDCTAET
jgi:hypothetical protein